MTRLFKSARFLLSGPTRKKFTRYYQSHVRYCQPRVRYSSSYGYGGVNAARPVQAGAGRKICVPLLALYDPTQRSIE